MLSSIRDDVRRDREVVVGREQQCSQLDSEHETDDEATCIVSVMNTATCIVSVMNVATWIVSAKGTMKPLL